MKIYASNTFVFLIFLSNLTAQTTPYKFDFGTDKPEKGYIGITQKSLYTAQMGYGFLSSEATIQSVERDEDKPSLTSNFITADQRFYFKVDVPEGNYAIQITFGDEKGASLTTVKVENRRLMFEKARTTEEVFLTQNVVVNVRNAAINNGQDSVKLKPRERVYWHWDKSLTFEFCDSLPKIAALDIVRIDKVTTLFLAGNSTVVDQMLEPYAAWGQMIPRFFEPVIAVANHAESGESLKSFIGEKRLEKVLSLMQSGDYLFIEFAHNDQKIKDLEPFVGYKNLLRQFIGLLIFFIHFNKSGKL